MHTAVHISIPGVSVAALAIAFGSVKDSTLDCETMRS